MTMITNKSIKSTPSLLCSVLSYNMSPLLQYVNFHLTGTCYFEEEIPAVKDVHNISDIKNSKTQSRLFEKSNQAFILDIFHNLANKRETHPSGGVL